MADDIAPWLDGLGLGQYADVFAENGIEFDDLPHLRDADFERDATRSHSAAPSVPQSPQTLESRTSDRDRESDASGASPGDQRNLTPPRSP